ncbi:hypothetical protein [Phenylobacterium aquaticum]|uniref:hypothetical protein n=1 Tax=Phenylobacterium aquaticum TaxID=1763816 RepID=UPI001F5DE900|nr:hypothetical protein [Phenylobacterium aquaticum]MCI3133142.1 hypothetical protein [Phenylobacterium aquaticum]
MIRSRLITAAGVLLIASVPLVARAQAPHGSWTRGPGTYSFTICKAEPATGPVAAGQGRGGGDCDITLPAGQSILITIQVWGAGGGGGGGTIGGVQGSGGDGGNGGGGGGYAKRTQPIYAPAAGVDVWTANVGAGGAGGHEVLMYDNTTVSVGAVGGDGGASSVLEDGPNGPFVVSATGGHGGNPSGTVRNPVQLLPSVAGQGSVNSWMGTSGLRGGYGANCSGGPGGLGGAGGGPGRTGAGYVNDGGAGGHGGYYHHVPRCTAASQNALLDDGARGGGGKVTLTW